MPVHHTDSDFNVQRFVDVEETVESHSNQMWILTSDLGDKTQLPTIDKSNFVNALKEENSRRKDLGFNVKDYGASGSDQRTTGSISAGSTTLTITSAIDFKNGQGIAIARAGAACTLTAPTGGSISQVGATGTTVYEYQVCALDLNNGMSPASPIFSISTGASSLSTSNYNTLSWSAVSGAVAYVIYGRTTTQKYIRAVVSGTSWKDTGTTSFGAPFNITGTSAPSVQTPRTLFTKIVSGGGTTTLTLANAAVTSTSGNQNVLHDDTQAILDALAVTEPLSATLLFSSGTFNYRAQINSTKTHLKGSGRQNTTLQLIKTLGSAPSIQIGTYVAENAPSGPANISDMTIKGGFWAVKKGDRDDSWGEGVRLNEQTKVERIYVQGFYKGIVFDSTGGHITLSNCVSTNNFYGLFIKVDHADYLIENGALNGNVFANVGIPYNQAITGTKFHRVHIGFAPYGFYKEAAPEGATGIENLFYEVTLDHSRFEAIGNGAIYVEGLTGNEGHSGVTSVTFINVGFSWNNSSKIPWVNKDYAVKIGYCQGKNYYKGGMYPFSDGTLGTWWIGLSSGYWDMDTEGQEYIVTGTGTNTGYFHIHNGTKNDKEGTGTIPSGATSTTVTIDKWSGYANSVFPTVTPTSNGGLTTYTLRVTNIRQSYTVGTGGNLQFDVHVDGGTPSSNLTFHYRY